MSTSRSRVACERLERRTLLAADVGATDGDDVIYLRPRISPHQGSWLLDVFVNADPGGTPTHVLPLYSLPQTSQFDAGAGDDRITFEKVDGAPQVRIVGGTGDDHMEVINAAAAGGEVTLMGGTGDDTLAFTGTAADDTISVRAETDYATHTIASRRTVFEMFERLRLNTGDGRDDVRVEPGTRLPPDVVIEAGAGDDAVNIGWGTTSFAAPITPITFTIDLGGGNDALTFRGGATVTSLRVEGREGDDEVSYRSGDRGTPDLLFDAGDGNDELKLEDLPHSFARHRFQYDPGLGDDRLSVSAYPASARGRFEIHSSHALYNDHLIEFGGVEHQTYSSGAWFYFASDAPDVTLSPVGNAHVVLTGGRMPRGLGGYSTQPTIEFRDGHYGLVQTSACGCLRDAFAGATLIVRADATVGTGSEQTLAAIEVDDGGKVTLGRDLATSSVRLNPGGTLDLDRHRLSIRVPIGDAPLALRQLEALIASGRNGSAGPWTGAGITSGAIAGDASQTLVAFIDPRIIEPRDVALVMERRLTGDATRDSRVNADDYFRIDRGFLAQPQDPLYADGDFNYDGRIDADDYFLIDQAFLAHSGVAATLTSSTSVAVTTPSNSTTSTAVRRRAEPDHQFFNATRRVRAIRRFR